MDKNSQSARESARRTDGRFGQQPKAETEVDLSAGEPEVVDLMQALKESIDRVKANRVKAPHTNKS